MGFTAPSGWNIWKMRFEKQSEGESDMKYYSTRDAAVRMDAAEAIKMGLSRDGGLLTPCEIPQIDRAFLESLVNVRYQERAAKVMGLYLTDYTYEELSGFAENAYGPEKFDCDAVAPVRTVDETTHCLELWHGPTSAFKDMALQMLPQLLSAALRKTGESKTVCILVATSGDTGKAAMEGFADVPQTKILVFYPKDGVSKVQETQMVTQDGANVGVCAVEGNFDDAQAGVKRIFSDEAIRATLADQPGQEFRDLWIEQEKPGDAQFLGQCPFFLQTFPVVKEDEVGPGLPAHVGEVVGAEVRGEEHRGVQAALQPL